MSQNMEHLNLVEKSIERVYGPALAWLYAKTKDLPVEVSNTPEDKNFYAPFVNGEIFYFTGDMCISLMQDQRITPHADVDGWVAEAWNTGAYNAHGACVKEAVLRCYIWKKMGYKVWIPKEFEQ